MSKKKASTPTQTHVTPRKGAPRGWAKEIVIVGPNLHVSLGKLAKVLSPWRISRLHSASHQKRLNLARGWIGLAGLKAMNCCKDFND